MTSSSLTRSSSPSAGISASPLLASSTLPSASPPLPALPCPLENAYRVEVVPRSGAFLVVAPRCAVEWEYFCKAAPRRSIALDGIVKGVTRENLLTRHFNFNHHEDVNRDITLCTAQQVAAYQSMGFADLLLHEGQPDFRVYTNDPDPDSAFASALLLYPQVAAPSPAAHRLLSLVGSLDISAGVRGPAVESLLMREGAWIFDPYFRAVSTLYDMDGYGVAQVLLEQHERIKLFMLGRGSTQRAHTDGESIYDGKGWALIKELGPFARLKAFQERPLQGLVILKAESEGGYRYSAVRGSRFSAFPLLVLTDILNRCESLIESGAESELSSALKDSTTSIPHGGTSSLRSVWHLISSASPSINQPWGGGDGVIGCLRQHGSRIAPPLMSSLLDRFIMDIAEVGYASGATTLKDVVMPH